MPKKSEFICFPCITALALILFFEDSLPFVSSILMGVYFAIHRLRLAWATLVPRSSIVSSLSRSEAAYLTYKEPNKGWFLLINVRLYRCSLKIADIYQ
jgi:hypothetical protein